MRSTRTALGEDGEVRASEHYGWPSFTDAAKATAARDTLAQQAALDEDRLAVVRHTQQAADRRDVAALEHARDLMVARAALAEARAETEARLGAVRVELAAQDYDRLTADDSTRQVERRREVEQLIHQRDLVCLKIELARAQAELAVQRPDEPAEVAPTPRTMRELRQAARELKVPRRARDTLDDLRRRVEDAEREARVDA